MPHWALKVVKAEWERAKLASVCSVISLGFPVSLAFRPEPSTSGWLAAALKQSVRSVDPARSQTDSYEAQWPRFKNPSPAPNQPGSLGRDSSNSVL